MMDAISKTLGAAVDVIDLKPSQVKVLGSSTAVALHEHSDADAERVETSIAYATKTITETIEQAADELPDLLQLAQDQQCPKMYQAAANFMKAISDMSKTLVEVAATKKATQSTEQPKSLVQNNTTVTNNTTYMSATDVLNDDT